MKGKDSNHEGRDKEMYKLRKDVKQNKRGRENERAPTRGVRMYIRWQKKEQGRRERERATVVKNRYGYRRKESDGEGEQTRECRNVDRGGGLKVK